MSAGSSCPGRFAELGPEVWRALGYDPHPGQALFHNSGARFKVLIAGARFGKSLATAREALLYVLTSGTTGWIVAPTYAHGAIEFRTLTSDLANLGIGLRSLRDSAGTMRVETTTGSIAAVKSAERPTSLLGEALDWVVVAEAARIKRDVWERFIRPRLVTRLGAGLIATTPAGPNWIKELYDRGQPSGTDARNPDWESWRFPTRANPLIDRGELDQVRRTVSRAAWDEQFEAEFVARSGLVYPAFSRRTHVAKLPGVLASLGGRRPQLVRGIDFGYVNPMVSLLIAVNEEGERFHVLAETVVTQCPMAQFAQQVLQTERALGAAEIVRSWADPSAPGLREELRRNGVDSSAGENDIRAGVEAVRWALEPHPLGGGPRLTVDPTCTALIGEFETYSFPAEPPPGGVEQPVKGNDHALDALRYALIRARRPAARYRIIR